MNNEQEFLPGFENIEKYKEIKKEKKETESAAIFRVRAEKMGMDFNRVDFYEGEIEINFNGQKKILKFRKGKPDSFIITKKPMEITIEGVDAKKLAKIPVNLQKIIYNEIEAFEKKDSYPVDLRFADVKRRVAENSSESELKLKFRPASIMYDEREEFRKFFEKL